MILPRPNENEAFSSYLVRFISDFNAILEFPDTEQRQAIAMIIFNTTKQSNGTDD